MDHNRGMPYLFGGFMAVAAGLISYLYGSESHTIYIRMALCMVVFYILGTILRNTLKNIKREVVINEELKRIAALEEERIKNAQNTESSLHGHNQAGYGQVGSSQAGQKINLAADDSNDEFSPMTVSRVITSKMKE